MGLCGNLSPRSSFNSKLSGNPQFFKPKTIIFFSQITKKITEITFEPLQKKFLKINSICRYYTVA